VNFVETFIDADQTEVAEIRIDPITQYRSLFTKKAFKANEVIIGFMARAEHKTPNYLTVQIAEDRHIELFPECLECANHSCDPNCFFDTTSMEFVTLRAIKAGEELKFFYPSAEWDMDQAFPCNCGSPDCVGMIKGAKYLSKEQQRRYRFTDFIQQKLGLKG
jgi:hypothetical protein